MIRKFPLLCLLISCGYLTLAEQPTKQKAKENGAEKEHFRAGCSFVDKQRYDEAVHEFQEAIAINPRDGRYYDNLGFCFRKLQKISEAIDAFNVATSIDPQDAYAHRELGISYCDKKDFSKAIDFLHESISLNASDEHAQFWLGYALYRVNDYSAALAALDKALKLSALDFDANYWRGLSLYKLNRFEEADQSLAKAVEIRPNDFNANLWLGMCLARQRDFNKAALNFEKAHEIKPDDKFAQVELFGSYLASSQTQKAASIYPHLVVAIGGFLVIVYCLWFAALLAFSLPIRDRTFPGFWFSLGWLGLFVEGQAAFLLLLASLPLLRWNECIFSAIILSALPIIVVALTGFARQPWGEPFRWPPWFGTPQFIMTCVTLIFCVLLVGNGFAVLYHYATNKPLPIQRTIPLVRSALQVNPIVAWCGVVVVIPCVEEILFRGLLLGAFQKIWGIGGAIFASSVVFVIIHLQVTGFLVLFLLGLILAWARLRTNSLGLPIALHAFNNGIVMLVLTFVPSLTVNH